MPVLKTAVCALALAVLSVISPVTSAAEEDACRLAYQELKSVYAQSTAQLTLVGSDPTAMTPYVVLHAGKDAGGFDVVQHLNGEIRGYAVRGDEGFDYNQDRGLTGPLAWHPTLIWHRILQKDGDLPGYSCILTGRIRLAGKKVTLLRLVPKDSIRYGYLLAVDDVHKLPVELSVLTPEGTIASRLTVLGVLPLDPKEIRFPLDEAAFANYREHSEPLPDYIHPWPELTIPEVYKLSGRGTLEAGEISAEYQTYSDGLTSFRVYRCERGPVLYPAINDGALTVLRRSGMRSEYAVVGEIPLKLAEHILQSVR